MSSNNDKITKKTSSVYRILKEENCFQHSDFNERYLPQLTRNMLQFKIMSIKLNIGTTKRYEYLNWYKENMPKFHYNETDFVLESTTLLCHHALSSFELLKRFLLNTLDLNKVKEKSDINLSNTPTLGKLINAINKITITKQEKVDEIIDNEFRNALAHDSWYLADDLFKFKNTRGEPKQLTGDELLFNVLKILRVDRTFTMRYTEDFYPESIKIYDDGLGKIMDELMPLYPDDAKI